MNQLFACIIRACILLILHLPLLLFAQHSLSVRATPLLMGSTRADDPSPAGIYGTHRLGFDGGIEYNYMFRSGLGIGAGLGMGLTSFDYRFSDPSKVNVMDKIPFPSYFYNALLLYTSYSFKFRKMNLKAYGGPGLRFYYHGNEHLVIEGTDRRTSFSRNSSAFRPSVPQVGNDYLLLAVDEPNASRQLEINAGFSLEKPLSKNSILVVGLRKTGGCSLRNR